MQTIINNLIGKLIGTLHDDRGEIAVKGIYDGVRQPSEKEKASILSPFPFPITSFYHHFIIILFSILMIILLM